MIEKPYSARLFAVTNFGLKSDAKVRSTRQRVRILDRNGFETIRDDISERMPKKIGKPHSRCIGDFAGFVKQQRIRKAWRVPPASCPKRTRGACAGHTKGSLEIWTALGSTGD